MLFSFKWADPRTMLVSPMLMENPYSEYWIKRLSRAYQISCMSLESVRIEEITIRDEWTSGPSDCFFTQRTSVMS